MRARQALQRGAVLITVLAALLVMALLATTSATLQAVEQSVSRNCLDGARAKLLASSGVEYAISEIRNFASQIGMAGTVPKSRESDCDESTAAEVSEPGGAEEGGGQL